jgi:hypothetical protein
MSTHEPRCVDWEEHDWEPVSVGRSTGVYRQRCPYCGIVAIVRQRFPLRARSSAIARGREPMSL